MNCLAKLALLVAMSALTAFSLSAPVTGTWKGKLASRFAPPQGGQAFTPEQVKQTQDLLNHIQITLTISANGTYVAVTKQVKQADATTKGKWKLKGKTLTLTPTAKGREPEIGTLSPNGKSLTFSLPKSMLERGVAGRAVFTKA